MFLDQIGPTDAMRRTLILQQKKTEKLTPAPVAAKRLPIPDYKFSPHEISTGKSTVMYAMLDDYAAPRGWKEVEYRWTRGQHTGTRRIAMLNPAKLPELLEHWTNDLWKYELI